MTAARWDQVFEIRLIVDDVDCPYTVWSIHHRKTDKRARLFFDSSEARRCAERLTLEAWDAATKGTRDLLDDMNRACAEEGVEARRIISEETGEFISLCWGSPDILAAVEAAERANAI